MAMVEEAVFCVPELLEHILDYCDALAACAGVNKSWLEAVRTVRRKRVILLIEQGFRWIDANPTCLALAGSAALWLHLGKPRSWTPNDVDVYYYGPVSNRRNERAIAAPSDAERDMMKYKGKFCHFTDYYEGPVIENIRYPYGKLQIILCGHFESAQSILDSFDITACMIAYTARDTEIKSRLFTEPPCAIAYVRPETEGERRTMARCAKYKARGYTNIGFTKKHVNVLQTNFLRTYKHPSLRHWMHRRRF